MRTAATAPEGTAERKPGRKCQGRQQAKAIYQLSGPRLSSDWKDVRIAVLEQQITDYEILRSHYAFLIEGPAEGRCRTGTSCRRKAERVSDPVGEASGTALLALTLADDPCRRAMMKRYAYGWLGALIIGAEASRDVPAMIHMVDMLMYAVKRQERGPDRERERRAGCTKSRFHPLLAGSGYWVRDARDQVCRCGDKEIISGVVVLADPLIAARCAQSSLSDYEAGRLCLMVRHVTKEHGSPRSP